jgi:hypothetical protein
MHLVTQAPTTPLADRSTTCVAGSRSSSPGWCPVVDAARSKPTAPADPAEVVRRLEDEITADTEATAEPTAADHNQAVPGVDEPPD